MTNVVGIPSNQLKIASLGKARIEKGYPSARKLISEGVPKGLAHALAPFQRGGVDFIIEKKGRALIADGKLFSDYCVITSIDPLSISFEHLDMGLGKVRFFAVMILWFFNQ